MKYFEFIWALLLMLLMSGCSGAQWREGLQGFSDGYNQSLKNQTHCTTTHLGNTAYTECQ